MKKPVFVTDGIYHIYNRGVDKRHVFNNDNDYSRFINDLYIFNNENVEVEPRKELVEILIFVLMPNHFHLMLRQNRENGIIRFMQKLGTGYTMYFNLKYEREGALFQGRYKAVQLQNETHFLYLPFYLHLNPLALMNVGGSTSAGQMMGFLEKYRWSSFLDYIGKSNFSSVISMDFLRESLGEPEEYRKETEKWLAEREKYMAKIQDVIIE